MHLFWDKGYEETSMADLVKATGVSRYGFYTEFGDKHDLFLKCVDRYADTAIKQTLSPLEEENASLPELRAYFERFVASAQSGQPQRGCLIGNTAMSMMNVDDAMAARIERHYTRMRAAFVNALNNAVRRGELAADEDVEALADYLVGAANGYLSCIRIGMSSTQIENFLRILLKGLA